MRKRHIVLVSAFLILSVLLSFNAGRIYETLSSNGQQDVGKQNIVFSGTVFPLAPSEGQIFYRTDLDEIFLYENTVWEEILKSRSISLDDLESKHYYSWVDGLWQNRTDMMAYPQSAYSYAVFTNGTYVYMKNGSSGETKWKCDNASAVINAALGNLTVGRTWKEKVLVLGNHTLSASIEIPSYSILEIDGYLSLADGVNDDMIHNPRSEWNNGNNDIEIKGGFLFGNRDNQVGLGDTNDYYNLRINGIRFWNVTGGLITGVYVNNCYDFGVDVSYSRGVVVDKCFFDDGGGDDDISIHKGENILVLGTVHRSHREGPHRPGNCIEIEDQSAQVAVIGAIAYDLDPSSAAAFDMHAHTSGTYGEGYPSGYNVAWIGCIALLNGVNMGFRIAAAELVTIDGCIIDNPLLHGIIVEGYNLPGVKSQYVTISNNIITRPNRHGIIVIPQTKPCNDILIEGNTIYDAGYNGINVAEGVNRVTVDSNKIYSAGWDGIRVLGDFAQISGNTIKDSTLHGILLDTANNCSVTGNMILDNTQDGIKIDNGDCNIVGHNQLSGNGWLPITVNGTGNIVQSNMGFRTEKVVSVIVANGELVPHSLAGTPTHVTVTCGNATYGGVPIVVGYDYSNTDSQNVAATVYWVNGTAISDDVILVTLSAVYEP